MSLFKENVKFSNYTLSLDLEGEVTICIKAETEIQIQNQYSKVFVFKENNLGIFPVSNNFLQVWGISGDKNVELDLKIPDFPFYKSTSKDSVCNFPKSNKLLFSASKISILKEFVSSLFKEKSLEYSWISEIDGNSLLMDFNDDQVQVMADDPVILSRLLRKILDWAQIPIVVSCLQLDKECFRKSLKFWVQELMMKRDLCPLQVELLEIKNDENGDIDYFDQEFLDELQDKSNGQTSVFSLGFISFKIQQVIHEYFSNRGALQEDIDKTVELVKQVMKNPDVELIDSIVFNTSDFS